MRRPDKDATDPVWCRSVLEEAPYLVLALADDPAPYAVPLCVALVEGTPYLHMALEGTKLDLLRRHPLVGFVAVVDAAVVAARTACAHGMRYRSVAGTGRCTVVDDPVEKRRALDAFARKYAGRAPDGYPEAALAATVVVRLEPIAIAGRRSGGG